MSEVPEDRRYTSKHEWARQEGNRILIGITDYAQDQLGDVVFVGLPESGASVTEGSRWERSSLRSRCPTCSVPLPGRWWPRTPRWKRAPS